MELKSQIFEKIVEYLKQYDVTKISVFGSYAIDKETNESDIDLLVDFNKKFSLLKFAEIEQNLSEYIGVKVDLLTKESISPYIFKEIQNDLKVIY